ncbi:MAG: hypothetical protein ACJAT2_000401 [Bacteriovoracaceae bacterium]|jgi:hypothetical protein
MNLLKATFLIICLTGSLWAQDRRAIKRQISDLSLRIEREAPYSEADTEDLLEARDLLREGLVLIGGQGGGGDFKLCINYAFEQYKRQYSSSAALERAQVKCKNVVDMKVLEFLFDKHKRNQSVGSAMDLATSQSDRTVKGKVELIEFSYDKHSRNTSSTSAATKAVMNARAQRNSRGALACFNQYYPIHSRTNSSTVAMDKTSETCSRF